MGEFNPVVDGGKVMGTLIYFVVRVLQTLFVTAKLFGDRGIMDKVICFVAYVLKTIYSDPFVDDRRIRDNWIFFLPCV